MALLGMDVDEVERIGRDLSTNQAQAVGTVMQAIQAHIGTLQSTWHGGDAQRFSQEWESTHKPQMQQLMQVIQEFGQAAVKEAAQQRQASQ